MGLGIGLTSPTSRWPQIGSSIFNTPGTASLTAAEIAGFVPRAARLEAAFGAMDARLIVLETN